MLSVVKRSGGHGPSGQPPGFGTPSSMSVRHLGQVAAVTLHFLAGPLFLVSEVPCAAAKGLFQKTAKDGRLSLFVGLCSSVDAPRIGNYRVAHSKSSFFWVGELPLPL